MDDRSAPCKALVLAGGGARGSYQVGVWRALMELDWHPQIITGTSVGSLNGAMFVLDQYETARDMWLAIRSKDVMELPEENADLSALHQFLRRVVKEGGMDVTPLEEIVERVLDEDALRAAPIRFGIVTVEQRGLRPRELTLEDMARISAPVPVLALAYGHMPLMLTRACPLQNVRDCGGCDRKGELLDRKGMRFPVRCSGPAGARTVYNPIPIYMGDRLKELPVELPLLYFTIETAARVREVLALVREGLPFDGPFTRGLYYKGTN